MCARKISLLLMYSREVFISFSLSLVLGSHCKIAGMVEKVRANVFHVDSDRQ